MVRRAPFEFDWSQIKFSHFHGFCKEILNRNSVDWPSGSGEDFFNKTIPDLVIKSIKKGIYDKYDAILIDEGQDYYFECMICYAIS